MLNLGYGFGLSTCSFRGLHVFLWDHKAELAQKTRGAKYQYLPEIFFQRIFCDSDLELSLKDTELVVAVTLSNHGIARGLPYLDPEVPICCASKGIEESTLMTMEEVLRRCLPLVPCTVVLFSRTFLAKELPKCTNCCCHSFSISGKRQTKLQLSWWLFSSLSYP